MEPEQVAPTEADRILDVLALRETARIWNASATVEEANLVATIRDAQRVLGDLRSRRKWLMGFVQCCEQEHSMEITGSELIPQRQRRRVAPASS